MRYLRSMGLLALLASTAAAQSTADTSRLVPVVITASRTNADQAVATTAATVLSGSALRARGISTVGAALREVPGASVVQTSAVGSQTSLFLRGGEPDYVQVLIDGVIVNEPGGTFNFANLTLDNVDRIEIIRGPASVLYGSDAVAGVIQIFTRQGSGVPRVEGGVRGGQHGLVDLDAAVSGGGARASYSLGGGHHASAGIYDFHNDARNSDASGRFQLSPTARSTVSLTGRYGDARYDFPTEYYGAPLDPDSYSTERRFALGLDATYAIHPRLDARVMAGLSRVRNTSDDRSDGPGDFGFTYEARSLRRSAEARLDLHVVPSATVTVGGDFDWQESETTGDEPTLGPLFERWSRAGYGQIVGNMSGRVTYTLGGRLEENERFGTLSSVRGGVGVALARATRLRVSAGTAFKEPQFTELTGGCCAVPNPGLDPEHSTSWEAGVEQGLWNDVFVIAATRFDQRFRDLIIFAPDPATPTRFHYENAQSAVARGWELEARAGRTGGPTARASVTALDASLHDPDSDSEQPLQRRPSRTGSLVIASPIGVRLTVVGDAAYVGRRHDIRFFPEAPFQAQERLPAYSLLGIAGSYRVGRLGGPRELELTARVDNLLDENYEAIAGFATPGRIASIGARIRFGR